MRTSRKTSGASHQAGQIMPQFSIDTLDGESICFAFRNRELARIIDQRSIQRKLIAKVLMCFGAAINQVLKAFTISVPQHPPTNHTACFSLYCCDDVDAFFFVSMNVKSSSSSIVCSSSGRGASGSCAAKALTQLITLVWCTF